MRINQFFNSGLRFLWVTIIVFILDRVTKQVALEYLSFYDALKVMPGFNLILSYNEGAAFSFLAHAGGWQSWVFGGIAIIVSVGILIWLSRLPRTHRWVSIALCFIVGGALGNLWDRIRYGYVIDFIQWYAGDFYWPVFNIADSAVCIGAVMLMMHSVSRRS